MRTDEHPWTSAWTLGGIAVALVLALGAFLRERRSPEPLIPRDLLRSRTTLAANTMMLVGAAGLFAMFFFLTLYMQVVLGWGALETGAAYLPFSAVMAVTSGVVAKALDGRSARGLLLVGPVIGGAGLWLMSGLEATSEYTAHLLPALVVTAFGLGLTFVPLINAATGGAGEADGGGASALLTTCQQIGAVLGIAVMVTIATQPVRRGDRRRDGAGGRRGRGLPGRVPRPGDRARRRGPARAAPAARAERRRPARAARVLAGRR